MNSKYIAQSLCDSTMEVLWAHTKDWALARQPDCTLAVRVGSGKATYCRHNRGSKDFILNYGIKMVESKIQSEFNCSNWTSGREVIERNYYGGELTLLNGLASVVCHEFAHFVQNLKGWRHDNSVHNAEFYHILDRMHQSGRADDVRSHLEAKLPGIDYVTSRKRIDLEAKGKQKGDLIKVNHNGKLIEGRVTKVNRKTYTADFGGFSGRIGFGAVVE